MLDIRTVCNFADYFVICSGESDRQLQAIADEIEKSLKKEGIAPRNSEGGPDSGWVLIDFGDVIAHIFSLAEREYYNLEELWSRAGTVLRIQ